MAHPWRTRELFLVLLYLMVALTVFAWRRSREQRRTIAALRVAEVALRREHDFAAAIIETVDALIVVLDRQGRIVRFNRACEILTGYLAEEVVNRPPWDLLLLPDEEAQVKAVFADLRAGRLPNHHTNHWRIKDGRCRLVAWRNTVLHDEVGAVEYVIGTGLDVTNEREVRAALRESEAQRVREQTLRRRRQHHLTEQESRVLDLLAAGTGNAAIATALHIQPNTVARYIHNIGVKLGLTAERITRQAVIAAARRLDLLLDGDTLLPGSLDGPAIELDENSSLS